MRPLTPGKVPIFQYILQTAGSIRRHTLVVNLDRNNVQTAWDGALNGVHVAKLFAEQSLALVDRVFASGPFIGKGLESLGEAICVAASQNDLWTTLVWHVRVQVLGSELAHELVKRWVALGSTVLQGGGKVDPTQDVGALGGVGNDDAARGMDV